MTYLVGLPKNAQYVTKTNKEHFLVTVFPAYRDSWPIIVWRTQDTQKFLPLMHLITDSQESNTWLSNLTLQIPTGSSDVQSLSEAITDPGEDLQSYKGEQGT